MYDAEKQVSKALPKMVKAAGSAQLREAFEGHLKETHGQIERLERVFEIIEEKARGKHCAGMAGILEEGKDILIGEFEDSALDARLVAGEGPPARVRCEHARE